MPGTEFCFNPQHWGYQGGTAGLDIHRSFHVAPPRILPLSQDWIVAETLQARSR